MHRFNPFGYHVYLDAPDLAGSDSMLINSFIAHIKKTMPLWINISGGSRWEQAMQLCERVRSECGYNIGIILRDIGHDGQPDDGIWRRMTPKEWYALRVVPIKSWLKKFDVVLMTDNESLEDDMTAYSQWHADLMPMAYADMVRLAFGRTSDGNPPETQFLRKAGSNNTPPMLPMFREAAKYPVGWFIYSPNNYFGQTPEMNNSRIDTYQRAWRMCQRENVRIPVTVLGEFGVLQTTKVNEGLYPDPERGFIALGWSEARYVNYSVEQATPWVFGFGVAACFFCVGLWKGGTLSIGQGFFSEVERVLELGIPLQINPANAAQFKIAKRLTISPVHSTAALYSKPDPAGIPSLILTGDNSCDVILAESGLLPPIPAFNIESNTRYYTHMLPIKLASDVIYYVDMMTVVFNPIGTSTNIPFPTDFDYRSSSFSVSSVIPYRVHKNPDIDSAIIELVYSGESFHYIPFNRLSPSEIHPVNQRYYWLPVIVKGSKGWMSSELIENDDPQPPPIDTVTISKLTIRSIIDTMEKSITALKGALGE